MFSRLSASASDTVSPVPTSAENRFSLIELKKLHSQLVENKIIIEDNQHLVIEILRVIAEMVVYGDNKSELLFDYFCEKNMLSLFLEIMRTEGGCPSIVHIQILQTLSILISCVKNETSLYYLLSNNYINDIIIYPHDFINDESLCAQFASFMKSLSLKLNIYTVQFFFIEETGAFPILTRAVELLTIPEPMIRIASQSTILNVYRVEDSRAIAYALQDDVLGVLCTQTIQYMEAQYENICKLSYQYYQFDVDHDEVNKSRLEGRIDDLVTGMGDWFFYLQDLLDLDVPILRKALINRIASDFVLDTLTPAILKQYKYHLHIKSLQQEQESIEGMNQLDEKDTIALTSSLSYLLQMMRTISHQSFHCAILITLFHPLSTNCRSKLISMSNQSTSQQVITTDNTKSFPLELNILRKAWDCLYEYNTQKNIILMSYINYLLIETLCSVPVDDQYYCSSTSSNITNNDVIQCEIKEDYVSKDKIGSSSIHSIISLNDQTKMNSIQILQALYILPNTNNNSNYNMEGKNNHVDNSSSIIVDIGEITIDMTDLMTNPRKDNNAILDETNSSEVSFRPFLVKQDSDTIINTTTTSNISTTTTSNISTTTTSSNNNIHIRVKLGRNDMLQPKASIKASELLYSDPLSLTSLYKLDTILHEYYPQFRSSLLIESFFAIFDNLEKYSLVSIQVILHLFYSLSISIYNMNKNVYDQQNPTNNNSNLSTMNHRSNSINSIKVDIINEGIDINSDSNNISATETSSKLNSPSTTTATANITKQYQNILTMLLYRIRNVCCIHANKLLHCLNDNHHISDMMIILIKEEIARIEKQKWKKSIARMYQNLWNTLPLLDNVNNEQYLDDYQLPITDYYLIRKDLQIFFILRPLVKEIEYMVTCNDYKEVKNIDQLSNSITDKDFLSLLDENIIPSTVTIGNSFDMRGKRFLDVKRILPMIRNYVYDSNINSMVISNDSIIKDNRKLSLSPKRQSWGSAMFGFGSNDRNSKKISSSSTPTSTSSRDNLNYTNNIDNIVSPNEKILFVQDSDLLLLVSCDQQDNKNGFKVVLAVPLINTEAIFDSTDNTKLIIVVRSSSTISFMNKIDAVNSNTITDIGIKCYEEIDYDINKKYIKQNNNNFLKPMININLWQLILKVDNQQANRLAVQHITKRHEEIITSKKEKLKDILHNWSLSPEDIILNKDNIN